MRIISIALLLFSSVISLAQEVWSTVANIPASARQSAFAFEAGGYGFVGTGNYAPGPVYLSDLWRYDPATNSWLQKASFPASVSRGVAVTINGIAYAGLGFMPNGVGNVNTWYSYDPVADQWTQKASFPGTARQDAFAVALNGKAYVGGGVFSSNPNVFQDLWEYNPVNDTWVQKGNLPTPRVFTTEFVINNKAYMVGGTTASGVHTNQVHEYDPATDTWTQKASYPIVVNELVSFAINGKGYAGLGSVTGTLQSQCYEYDPIADQWQSVAIFPGTLRTQSIAFQAGNSGFVFAGRSSSGTYLNDLLRYTPASITGTTELTDVKLAGAYPNPTTGIVNIESSYLYHELSVFDMQGRRILHQSDIEKNASELNLSDFEEGVYLLEVTGNLQKSSIRIVVKR